MSPSLTHTLEKAFKWASITLGVMTLAMFLLGTGLIRSDFLSAYLTLKKVPVPWVILSSEEVDNGTTIPADTNVVFHLPLTFDTIGREILLGHKGDDVKYWGYCFPENYDPSIVETRAGFPGQMFLSEKEREVRALAAAKNQPRFSFFNPPSKSEVERLSQVNKGSIRHQIEIFSSGMLCFVMTDRSLAIGLDYDEDGLNGKLESEVGTDPDNPDSDGDGITDGIEYLTRTNPLVRDTDSDGIIDGIEDKNWNGRVDTEETDTRVSDSDRDGLCDGYCRMKLGDGQELYAGEDKNLNGLVDSGETDPLKIDSEGDGYGDYQRFFKCLLAGGSQC